jgi:hypothetical protein
MSLAIVMGVSMLPIVYWAIVEMIDDAKREKNKHRNR